MDDRMLHEYRRDPDPRFARDLRERLRRQEGRRSPVAGRVVRLAALAAGVALVAALFTIPSVRVSAQSFLELFRVRRFAAVPFSESRFETLRSLEQGKDHGLLVLDKEETVLDPGPMRYVPSREAASPEAGFAVSAPSYLPEGLVADSVFVEGAGAMRLSVSEAKLRSVLQRLDLNDVEVPTGLDGRWIEVKKPPVVFQKFRSPRNGRAMLVQARSPEVSVPAGWDVERLAEIGLRVLGLDTGEARRIARSTDWRSTLLVPVPMNVSTFRQVTVRGQSGLLITTSTRGQDGRRREGAMLMWTQGERVFCLQGNLSGRDLMQMAESVS
ncbi:MAG TPA: hypothetical protein VFM00_07825 [Candidatus Eisenbacteria bacterium]|nr:hypothetical protein [Candidatus Eisenbacteria bacterium]